MIRNNAVTRIVYGFWGGGREWWFEDWRYGVGRSLGLKDHGRGQCVHSG